MDEKQEPQLPHRFSDDHCSEVVKLIKDMANYDPSQRPSASAIRQSIELKNFIQEVEMKREKVHNCILVIL